jgi:hypothetical protein
MKLLGSLGKLAAGLLLLTAQASALTYKGFSLGANRADGACKYMADWKKDFQTIKSWNKGFNAVRLYACSDCNSKEFLFIPAFSLLLTNSRHSSWQGCSRCQGYWHQDPCRRLGY